MTRLINLLEAPDSWSSNPFEDLEQFVYDKPDGQTINEYVIERFQLDVNAVGTEEDARFIRSSVKSALRLIRSDFAIGNPKIYVVAMSDDCEFGIEKLNGVTGYAFGKNILVAIHLRSCWQKSFTYTLVHELHHIARMPYYGEGATFLDWLIFEGLADNYAVSRTGHGLPIWVRTSFDQVERYLPKIRRFWKRYPNKNAKSWFFGDDKKDIPPWLGYATGYRLVQSYIEKYPGKDWRELISIPSDEFVN